MPWILLIATIMSGSLVIWSLISSGGRRLGLLTFISLYFVIMILGSWNIVGDVGSEPFLNGSIVILTGVIGMFVGVLSSWNDGRFFRRSYATLAPASAGQLRIVKVLVFVSIAVGCLYYFLSGTVPLVEFVRSLMQGGTADLDALRVRIYTTGSERGEVSYFGQGYLRQFYGNILPWAALVLLLQDLLERRRLRGYTLFAVLAAGFFSLASGQRWPILYLVFAYVLALCLYSDEGRLLRTLRRPTVLLSGIIAVSLLSALTIGQSRAGTLGEAMGTVFTRIAGTDVRTFFRLQEYVDAMGLRFFGETWLMDLKAFLPGPRPTFSVWVHQVLYGSANTAPPTLLGSFYVNFGIVGVLLGLFAVTRFVSSLDTTFYRRKTISPLNIATIAYAIMHLGASLHTDFVPKLYGVVFVVVLNMGVRLLAPLLSASQWGSTSRVRNPVFKDDMVAR